MDSQLRELNNLLKACNDDFKPSVQKAIDERKAEIGYVEPELVGLKDTYSKMQRMVPEMGEHVVFFSDTTEELMIDYFVERDMSNMNSDCMAEILRDGIAGYTELSHMELLDQWMSSYDDADQHEYDLKVKEECDMWIAVTIEQALLK